MPILWVVIIVAIAILQLSQAKGRTELRGAPFENEKTRTHNVTKPARNPNTPHSRTKTAEQPEVVVKVLEPVPKLVQSRVGQAGIPGVTSVDLMQAIVLSEILAPPRAKQPRRRQ